MNIGQIVRWIVLWPLGTFLAVTVSLLRGLPYSNKMWMPAAIGSAVGNLLWMLTMRWWNTKEEQK